MHDTSSGPAGGEGTSLDIVKQVLSVVESRSVVDAGTVTEASIRSFLDAGAETVYAFEPIPAELETEHHGRVLGGQGQLWTEYLEGPKQVEYMAFPRLTELAEVLWSQQSRRNYADFLTRLDEHLRRLSILDVAYRPPGP